jgi:hypothetical protein
VAIGTSGLALYGGNTQSGKYGYIGSQNYAAYFSGDVKVAGTGNGVIFSDGTKQTTASSGLWQVSGSNMYYNNGNVGVGTTGPAAKLDVAGQVKITGGSPAAGKVLTSDADGLATWETLSGVGDSDWIISGNNMYSGVSGNVGIGTTSPFAKLVVSNSAAPDGPTIGMRTGGSGSTNTFFEIFKNDYDAGYTINQARKGLSITDNSTTWTISTNRNAGDWGQKLRFGTLTTAENYTSGFNDWMVIQDNGNVGIGTTSPTSKLDVQNTFDGPYGLCDIKAQAGVMNASFGGYGIRVMNSDNRNYPYGGDIYGGYFSTIAPPSYSCPDYCTRSYSVFSEVLYNESGGPDISYAVYGKNSLNGSVGALGCRDFYGGGPGDAGVYGYSNSYGVYGKSGSSNGYAGYFTGGRNYFQGNVGIGTANPTEKLEVADGTIKATNSATTGKAVYGEASNNDDSVKFGGYFTAAGPNGVGVYGQGSVGVRSDGDLVVSGASSAYRGNIGPNKGAPFPRPAYDSGWTAIAQDELLTLTHNIGGNVDNYVVDMMFASNGTIHNRGFGQYAYFIDETEYLKGAYWTGLTANTIQVKRREDDSGVNRVRIRIWVYN